MVGGLLPCGPPHQICSNVFDLVHVAGVRLQEVATTTLQKIGVRVRGQHPADCFGKAIVDLFDLRLHDVYRRLLRGRPSFTHLELAVAQLSPVAGTQIALIRPLALVTGKGRSRPLSSQSLLTANSNWSRIKGQHGKKKFRSLNFMRINIIIISHHVRPLSETSGLSLIIISDLSKLLSKCTNAHTSIREMVQLWL